jgi:cytochrome c oxidase subunit 2
VVVYIITMIVVIIGALRRRAKSTLPDDPMIEPDPASETRITATVIGSVAITVLVLFVLLFGDFITGRRVHALAYEPHPMEIQVTGHQWWWAVRYMDQNPSLIVDDANEIHIPKGVPVRIDLSSTDVIHSFWVPNLHGKKDLVPGHDAAIFIRADSIPNGEKQHVYWGQCAEFCGYEHAKMRFAVVVHEPDDWQQWIASARQPSQAPQTPLQSRGQQIFQSYTCNMCHTIQGINANGRIGPPLTHIASRMTLAAGWLPNTQGHLGGWILDPQTIKPGVRMPQHNLSGDDLQALLEYLRSLK